MVGVRRDDDFSSNLDEVSKKNEISYEKIKSIGLGVAELTQKLRKNFDISDNINEVVVAHIGNLQRNDVAVGSVILSVDP
jgi:hypothetical protein